MNAISLIQLEVVRQQTPALSFQQLNINLPCPSATLQVSASEIAPFSAYISPNELARLDLPPLDFTEGIVLYGSAPIWLYVYLVDRLRAAPWIASYDLRTRKAIVIKSAVAAPEVGDLVSLPIQATPGLAIAIGGSPNSGKSVLSNRLRQAFMNQVPHYRVYLHRANWDGEGNWAYEMDDRTVTRQLVERGKFKIHQLPQPDKLLSNYFEYHQRAIASVREVIDLVLVDFGGYVDPLKLPAVNACSHSIIISRDPDEVANWQQLFSNLKPIAVIHSVLEPCCELRRSEPFLELQAGVWQRETPAVLPKVLFEEVLRSLQNNR